MTWSELPALVAPLVAALITSPATAYADEAVPTVDQVVADLAEMTDPAADRSAVITPGLSPEETATTSKYLTAMSEKNLLPLDFVVTNIQPAPNGFAGATVAINGNWHQALRPGPVVLVHLGGRWLLTHDSARPVLEAIFTDATKRSSPGAFPVHPGVVP